MTALFQARYLRVDGAPSRTDWQDNDAPWEAGRVRALLGMTCRALGDEVTAQLEFDAARRVFERLGAAPDLARVDRLRAPAGPASAGTLTSRERQILALIARGVTKSGNRRRARISERTVDRHVSNILTKLDLPSRSAATHTPTTPETQWFIRLAFAWFALVPSVDRESSEAADASSPVFASS
jgi:DNA-binding CsgD family transcriptional regulator